MVALDAVASLVHLKLKFNNLHGEPITINSDLEGVKRIYQEVYKDQGKCKVREINITSLVSQLRSTNVQPPARRTNHDDQVSKSSWLCLQPYYVVVYLNN